MHTITFPALGWLKPKVRVSLHTTIGKWPIITWLWLRTAAHAQAREDNSHHL